MPVKKGLVYRVRERVDETFSQINGIKTRKRISQRIKAWAQIRRLIESVKNWNRTMNNAFAKEIRVFSLEPGVAGRRFHIDSLKGSEYFPIEPLFFFFKKKG